MTAKNQLLKNDSMLGPYKILRLIGEGGMGEVYEAVDESLNRRVAIKVISPSLMGDQLIVKRFLAEGKALARLNHQNVVTVYALGVENSIHYIAMEYIAGRPLDLLVRREPLTFNEIYNFMRQILEGVKTLHENGIIHRDLKPKNLIVSNENVVKIVDFGVAKTDAQIDLDLTSTGMLVGSVAYMSPEVVCGEAATIQSDIWSLGIIFYEMLFRQKPFAGSNPLAVLEKIKNEGMVFPQGKRDDMPDGIRWIVFKMCEKTLDRRYPNVSEIIKDLKSFDIEAPAPLPSSPPALEKRVIANEQEVKLNLKKEGLSDSEIRRIIDSAIEIQEKWGDTDFRHLQLINNVLSLKISDAAVAAARNSFNKSHSGSSRSPVSEVVKKKKLPRFYSAVAAGAVALVFGLIYLASPSGDKLAPPEGSDLGVQLQMQSPLNEETVWLNGNEPIQFQWNVGSGPRATLQISTDPRFQNLVVNQKNAASPLPVLNLKPGILYHWRLQSPAGSFVGPWKFNVGEIAPPMLVTPMHSMQTNLNSLTLKWQSKMGVKIYRWQLAKDQNYKSIVQDQTTSTNQVEVNGLEPGSYFWRVSAADIKPLLDLWSENRQFIIESMPPKAQRIEFSPPPMALPSPPPPILASPKAIKRPLSVPRVSQAKTLFTVRYKKSVDIRSPSSVRGVAFDVPTLKWSNVKNAKSYEVQVSRSSDFSSSEQSETGYQSTYKWASVRPGVFYWRVRATSASGEKSAFSSTAQLQVQLSAPFVRLTPGKTPTLTWEPIYGASAYRVIVAKDRKLVRVVSNQRVEKEILNLNQSEAGTYYFKVVALDSNSQVIGPYSEIGEAKIESERERQPASKPLPSLPTPTVQLPLSGVSIVPMDDRAVPVVFKWQKVKEAKSYRVEISSYSNFSSLLYTLTSLDSQLVMKKELPTGKIYWRIRAESADLKSNWTAPLYFEISKP